MVVDASAIIAVLNREPGAERLEVEIDRRRGKLLVSPLTLFEATIGLARARGKSDRKSTRSEIQLAHAAVRAFVEANDVREIDVTPDIGARAVEAATKYGKVVGHPAGLNFGDCFAYACAQAHAAALLFKGDDFTKTDIAR